MKPHIAREIEALRDMTVAELREKYAEVIGEETRSRHKVFLQKRIVWRLQANDEGGLSERALRRAEELANEADLRLPAPKGAQRGAVAIGRTVTGRLAISHDRRLPMPGARRSNDRSPGGSWPHASQSDLPHISTPRTGGDRTHRSEQARVRP